jgi:hypothetical protein
MGLRSFFTGGSPPPRGRTFEDRSPAERVYYYFQHVALRDAALHAGHKSWSEVIEAGRIGEQNARYFWAKATHAAVAAGAVPPASLRMLSDPAAQAALEAGAATVSDVTVCRYRRKEYTAWVLDMPSPKFVGDAHFIAAMSKDEGAESTEGQGAGVRYVLLEASFTPEPMLCEWTRDGEHVNHGSRPALDRDSFASEVLGLAGAGR